MTVRRRLSPEDRRSELIDKTLDVLEDLPACDVGIDDVAERAHVSRSLVYRYFDGIDDLMRHAQRRFFLPLCADLLAALEPQRAPLDQLRAIIEATVHFAVQRPTTFGHLVDGGLRRSVKSDALLAPMQVVTAAVRPGRDGAILARATAALVETGTVAWLREGPRDIGPLVDLLLSLAAPGLAGQALTSDDAQTPSFANAGMNRILSSSRWGPASAGEASLGPATVPTPSVDRRFQNTPVA